MTRHGLMDDQWDLISDIFPPASRVGGQPTDWRKVVDAILWIVRSGAPWRDLPEEEFGPWETVYGLFNTRNADGTLDKILNGLRGAFIDTGEIDENPWCIDGTMARAHRCAAGGGKKTIRRSQLITH